MPAHDSLFNQLTDLLHLEARALDQLIVGLQANRTAFVAIRASDVGQGITSLEPTWAMIDDLERRRAALLDEIRAATEITGKLRISKLIPLATRHVGERLRGAADAADAAARRVRAETTAGARLLRVSQQAHDGVLLALTGERSATRTGYDKKAYRIDTTAGHGNLVLGTA